MSNLKVLNMSGKEVSTVELNAEVFGVEPNEVVMHAAVVNHLANKRQGTQSTKTRAEVRGGGAKPWKQKGTGRARQGSIRAPQWIKGGIALGPKPRSYAYRINKKTRRLALVSALSAKCQANEIIVIDSIVLNEIKTKNFVSFMSAIGVEGKSLVVLPEVVTNVVKSASNVEKVKTTLCTTLSVYDILNAKNLIIDQKALEKIQEVYA